MGAVLVANAPFRWTPGLTALVTAAEPLLAADGGANSLARIGVVPQAVVGDLDSILPVTRAWLGEERMIRVPDQDHTDLEKALSHAFDVLGVTSLTVLGALGARTDHAVHNLGLLCRFALGPDLVLIDGQAQLLALQGERVLPATAGETWSFWTFDPSVRVTVDGVRWPVSSRRLDPTAGPSTSNLATGDLVRVRADGGAVLIRRQPASGRVDAPAHRPQGRTEGRAR